MSSDSSFPFTLLSPHTSNRGKLVEVDLLSKLASSLNDKQAGADETPDLVKKLAKYEGAGFGCKVKEKKISASDVSDQQCRFMITKQIVEEKIKPMMTREEIAMANLTNSERCSDRGGQTGGRKRGREHKGLEAMVYDRSGWGCQLYLTRWDSAEASVLKGANYKEFHRRSHFAAGDLVEMWAFKGRDDKLGFFIGKKVDLKLSL